MLAEGKAKAMLAKAGVAVPRGVSGATLPEVQALASALSAPLALKGLGFAHKTEAGAVRLGLATLAGQAEMPGATGYLAEEMVTGVVAEVLLGLRRDPVYGVTLTLGMGGVTAELLADTLTLVAPVTVDVKFLCARVLARPGDRPRTRRTSSHSSQTALSRRSI
jgi:acyl-CoA synthetase (NDP forming)